MKDEEFLNLLETDQLRPRLKDLEKIKSMLESAETTIKVAKSIHLNEESATIIFREAYESIRQLGDAKLWLKGYEPRNHEVSLEILKDVEIKNKVLLNKLSRFKKIRNDANYRGFKVTLNQANEILEFWNKCGEDLLKTITQDAKKGNKHL